MDTGTQKCKERKRRAQKIAKKLAELFPHPTVSHLHNSPWQLLVGVILSAQTTDKKVDEVLPKLFKKYKTIDDFASSTPGGIEAIINEIGLYRSKARYLIGAAQYIKQAHNGRVPQTMRELVSLPGVGRKTANIVLGSAFNKYVGIPVDTHVQRFAQKFDLTDSNNPATIEKDLMQLLPQGQWYLFSLRLVRYGQQVCSARKHECKSHPLTKIYPLAATKWP